MSELLEIKDFVQKLAQSMAHALEMDTQVIDDEYNRVGGTVQQEIPQNGGIIKKILETGEYQILGRAKSGVSCIKCPKYQICTEMAFLHCPILYNNRIVGVLGLICYNQTTTDKLIHRTDLLLGFIQNMCDIITLKLNEQETYRREQEMYHRLEQHNNILDTVIDKVSDGYVLLNASNKITNVNQQALQIIGQDNILNKDITKVIPDLANNEVLLRQVQSTYDEIHIENKSYDAFITVISKDKDIGTIINFKTIKKLGNRIYSRGKPQTEITFDSIVGDSRQIKEVKNLAKKVSHNSPNILILGESGTGKELFAHAIHNASPRKNQPFVPVNCAAIPGDLLESELFGYVGGAFTGASKTGKIGKFELADSGTIFLDEIGDMPMQLQAKILRVLQDGRVDKIGASQQIEIDMRVIAATNKNLEELIAQNKFREDLYYRLNVIPLNIPPLRERDGDILLMIDHFLNKYCREYNCPPKKINEEALKLMTTYSWPGNIRELENVVQYLVSISEGAEIIGGEFLPQKMMNQRIVSPHIDDSAARSMNLRDIERNRIFTALDQFGNTTMGKKFAADSLGISLTTFYRKLKKYGSSAEKI